jgi:hypothetical protein
VLDFGPELRIITCEKDREIAVVTWVEERAGILLEALGIREHAFMRRDCEFCAPRQIELTELLRGCRNTDLSRSHIPGFSQPRKRLGVCSQAVGGALSYGCRI